MRMRTIKPWWVIAAFLSGLAFAMFAEELILSTQESRLEFAAPRVHFLVGKPLERLRNASEVPFAFKITLWSGTRSHLLREVPARFVVSYDLWEEKFSVTKLVTPRRTARHLTNNAAEAWCLQEMSQDVTGVSANEPLWARLEIRAEDGQGSRSAVRTRKHHRLRHQPDQPDRDFQPSCRNDAAPLDRRDRTRDAG